MLKTLSLLPDGERDADAEDSNGSETRMLRALEAMSSQPPPRADTASPPPRPQQRQDPPRDGPHRDGPRDANPPHHRARHRFVRDGEVPVVHMATPRARDAAPLAPARDPAEHARLQQAAEDQRQRADQADRAKQDALTQLRVLQTKFAHAEMALSDASAIAEARLHEIQDLQTQLRQLNRPEPAAQAGTVIRRPVGRPRRSPLPVAAAVPDDAAPQNEPQPVEWWLTPAPMRRRSRA